MKTRRTQLFTESSAHHACQSPSRPYWGKQRQASRSAEAQDNAKRDYWQLVANDMRQALWIQLT